MLRKVLLCLSTLLLSLGGLKAQGRVPVEDIFILSSHTASSEWAQQMLAPIEQLRWERQELVINLEHLQLLSHRSVEDLEHTVDSILQSRPAQPRLVIVLGGSAFNYAPTIQKKWHDVPMLLIGEQDYYCDIDYTLHCTGDPQAKRYPIASLRANLTLITAPPMIRRTVEAILQVQPGLKKLFFVTGENYLSKERQWRLEEYLQERHPSIEYHCISSSNTSTDRLLDILKKESGADMAVFYGSWLVRKGYLESVSTRHNTVALIESIAPVYTMFASNLEKHPNVVGYYSYSQSEYDLSVRQYISYILDQGIQPSNLPYINLQAGFPTLNYHAMEYFGLDTRLIPDEAEVFGEPVSFWDANRRQIMWVGIVTFMSLIIFVLLTLGSSLAHMRKARDIAQNANRMKSAFIQNMSHEIRTPLNSIIGFSQLLGMPDGALTPEEKEEYLGYVMNSSSLLTMMINDMLSLSDMENGRYAVNPAPTNLNEMARQAIKTVENRLSSGVQIVRQPGLDEDARYMTDGMRVQQILINFLTNACKHTTSGQIVIASSLTENPGYITFSVADTGPGVPPEKAESIFDRFVKLDSSKQGAGLGLSICRIMADSLGGKVWLDTQYTDGARFVLIIPEKECS